MAPWVCRAALKRSVGKLFYHAGFEDFQPSALESVTDVAGEYFRKLAENFNCFREQPKAEAEAPRYTQEEQVLHSLHENGVDLEGLETYVKDDVERLTTKLGVVHERMKAHLADLLVSNTHILILPDHHRLHLNSDLPLATTQVQTASVPSMMEASNSLVVTLLKTSTKTSLASVNSVWQTNSAWKVSACLCIFCRTVCTVATRLKTKGQSPQAAWSSPRLLPTTPSASNIYPTTSAWCKTSSARSYARTTTRRWSKTKICRRSSAFPSPDCRPRARSRHRGNVRSANNNRQPRRSASWRKTRNSKRLWANSNYRCQSRETTGTNRRKSTATSTAP
jgi:hypothetical protein